MRSVFLRARLHAEIQQAASRHGTRSDSAQFHIRQLWRGSSLGITGALPATGGSAWHLALSRADRHRFDPMQTLDRILLEDVMSRDFLLTSAKTRVLQASVLIVFALFLVLLIVQDVMFPGPTRQLANSRSELAVGSTDTTGSSTIPRTLSPDESLQP
jgi:hypothetical protein